MRELDLRIGDAKEFMKIKKWCDENNHEIIFEKDPDGVWRPHIRLNIDGLTEDKAI